MHNVLIAKLVKLRRPLDSPGKKLSLAAVEALSTV